jgi:hypothetical protein
VWENLVGWIMVVSCVMQIYQWKGRNINVRVDHKKVHQIMLGFIIWFFLICWLFKVFAFIVHHLVLVVKLEYRLLTWLKKPIKVSKYTHITFYVIDYVYYKGSSNNFDNGNKQTSNFNYVKFKALHYILKIIHI